MRSRVLLLGTSLALGVAAPALAQTAGPSRPLYADADQSPRDTLPPPLGRHTIARWIDVQAATLGLVYRRIDNGQHVHTLDALQWAPTLRGRVRFDAADRYALHFGIQGGRAFRLSWNGTGVGSQDFMHDLPLRHLYVSATPRAGVALQAGSLTVQRGESSEITTVDNDGYVMGERVVLTRRAGLFFDEIAVTNAWLGDDAAPSVFDRAARLDDRNYRQLVVTRRLSSGAALSAEYTAHAGRRTLRQALALRMPARLGVDLVRLEQYERVRPDRAYGVAVVAEKTLSHGVRVGGGVASVDTRYGRWNGDRYDVGEHVFGQVSAPVLGYLSLVGFYGRELHATPSTANLNRIDVQATYDVLAHWKATRRR